MPALHSIAHGRSLQLRYALALPASWQWAGGRQLAGGRANPPCCAPSAQAFNPGNRDSSSRGSKGKARLSAHTGDREANKWVLEPEVEEAIEEVLERDPQKDKARKYMRTLSTFTFDRWSSHRSVNQYWRHISGIFQSSIVRGLSGPLLYVAAVSTVVCAYETLRQAGMLGAAPSFILPTAPFDLTSFALSLLLVFRTNTSYDRWLEVCTTWGGIANRSRDTVRQLVSYLAAQSSSDGAGSLSREAAAPNSANGASSRSSSSSTSGGSVSQGSSGSLPLPTAVAMARWVVAYVRSLKGQLTEDSDLEDELAGVLGQGELQLLMDAHHRPSFALSVLTELLAAAPLRESHRLRIDENLTFLEDAVGTCERILRTPIPLSYTRHTSRFMVIWLSLLPLGLWPSCGFGTIPLAVVIAFLLLGIEEIGVQIEEPFGILPLDDLCEEIEGDLFSILEEAPSAKQTAAAAAAAALAEIAADAATGAAGAASTSTNSSSDPTTAAGASGGDATDAAAEPSTALEVLNGTSSFGHWFAAQRQRLSSGSRQGRIPRREWAEAGEARVFNKRVRRVRGGMEPRGPAGNASIIYNSIIDETWEEEVKSTRGR